MPFCPDCGTKVSEGTQFCPECGKLLIKAQREQSIISEAQEEADDAELETGGAEMKRDIRSWGFALVVLGVIHVVFSGFLDPVWGGILIAIGIACLFIRRRGMYIAIGIALMLAGIMNILLTVFGGWTIFGVVQIGLGIYEIHKFRKYGRIRYARTQDNESITSASYQERSGGQHRIRKKLLVVLGVVVVVIILTAVIVGIPGQQAEPEPAIPAHLTTYTDGQGRFSISYPPEWELGLEYLEYISTEEAQFLFMAGMPAIEGYDASVNIAVAQCPLIMCIHDIMVKTEIETMKAVDPGYRELSRVKTTVDGRTATILVSQGTVDYSPTYHYMQMFLLVGMTEWVVTCGTPSDEYSKWEDDFDAIVRSLRISK